jgi:hypothetical protein
MAVFKEAIKLLPANGDGVPSKIIRIAFYPSRLVTSSKSKPGNQEHSYRNKFLHGFYFLGLAPAVTGFNKEGFRLSGESSSTTRAPVPA